MVAFLRKESDNSRLVDHFSFATSASKTLSVEDDRVPPFWIQILGSAFVK